MNFLLVVLFIAVLLALYFMGTSVGFALSLTGLVLMMTPYVPYQPRLVAQTMVSGVDSFVLLAIPFFLLTGLYMNMFGLTEELFEFAKAIMGPTKGGLAHVNVLASILFSGMTGSASADAAGLGVVEYRAMRDAGYDRGFSAGLTGASSIIGPIIPPSIPIIIYGVLAQVSIGALFIAGIVPGLLMGVVLLVMSTYFAHRNGYERGPDWSATKLWTTFKHAAPALGTPVLIVGGILSGFFTATEAGAVALFYTLLIGVVFYPRVGWSEFVEVTYEGLITTASLTFIIASASLYGFLLRRAEIPSMLTEAAVGVTADPFYLLVLLVVVLMIVGLMLETIAAITILVPVFMPIINRVGLDPVHFGIVMIITLMIGLLTPPFGMVLFILERVTDVSLERIFRGVIPFYIPLVVILALIIVFPWLATALPHAIGL